jgi:cytochrome d ubiquinol oxidase subunit II
VDLPTVWFVLIALLWLGYLVLEGFDFGVGMLLPVLGRTNTERRVLINTIGPVWDGNEVWLIVAGGATFATFAAFPEWYATLFSGFYLPLLLILVALIVRGVSFEYRGMVDTDRWRRGWDAAIIFGSLVPSVLWGVAFANLVAGVPIDAQKHYTGTLATLLNPYALLGGLAFLLVFLLHGSLFLGLKTRGEIQQRAVALSARLAVPALVVAGIFVLWTQVSHGKTWTWLPVLVAAAALAATVGAARAGREGLGFSLTCLTVMATVVLIFGCLFPDVMPSSTDPSFSLTIDNASSTPYTLKVITWVAVFLTPLVIAYQSYTYWVFRRRIGVQDIPVGAH